MTPNFWTIVFVIIHSWLFQMAHCIVTPYTQHVPRCTLCELHLHSVTCICAAPVVHNQRRLYTSDTSDPSDTLPWGGQRHPGSPSPQRLHRGVFEPHGATSSPTSPRPPGGLLCSRRRALLHPSALLRLPPPARHLSAPLSPRRASASLLQQEAEAQTRPGPLWLICLQV